MTSALYFLICQYHRDKLVSIVPVITNDREGETTIKRLLDLKDTEILY
jgi:hypothetical protein